MKSQWKTKPNHATLCSMALILSWFYFFNALTPTHNLSHDIYALCTWLIPHPFSYMFHHYAPSFTHDPLGSSRLCYPPLCLYTYSSYLSSIVQLQSVPSMLFATPSMPTPFSLIIISQLNWHLYYHYYAHSLGCASFMYLSSLESIGDTCFKLVYPPDS
jgi:hypothetical protein